MKIKDLNPPIDWIDVLISTIIIVSFLGVYIWVQFKDNKDEVAEKKACIEVHAKLNRNESTILCGTLVKDDKND